MPSRSREIACFWSATAWPRSASRQRATPSPAMSALSHPHGRVRPDRDRDLGLDEVSEQAGCLGRQRRSGPQRVDRTVYVFTTSQVDLPTVFEGFRQRILRVSYCDTPIRTVVATSSPGNIGAYISGHGPSRSGRVAALCLVAVGMSSKKRWTSPQPQGFRIRRARENLPARAGSVQAGRFGSGSAPRCQPGTVPRFVVISRASRTVVSVACCREICTSSPARSESCPEYVITQCFRREGHRSAGRSHPSHSSAGLAGSISGKTSMRTSRSWSTALRRCEISFL